MILSKDKQKMVKIIAIFFALQGLIWIALSLIGIIVKISPPERLTDNRQKFTSYEQYLSQIIYNSFLCSKQSCDDNNNNSVIRPVDFQAFLWTYFVASFIWVAASSDQFFSIKYKKARQAYVTLILGIAVLLASVIDLVFVALLITDYANCNFSFNHEASTATTTTQCENSLIQPDCKLAKGIIMTLAARGYALWALNVTLGIFLITIFVKATRTPALLAYGNNTIPRIKIPEKRKTPSPIDETMFFGDNPAFAGSTPYMNSKNRNSKPVALNHKGQNFYY